MFALAVCLAAGSIRLRRVYCRLRAATERAKEAIHGPSRNRVSNHGTTGTSTDFHEFAVSAVCRVVTSPSHEATPKRQRSFKTQPSRLSRDRTKSIDDSTRASPQPGRGRECHQSSRKSVCRWWIRPVSSSSLTVKRWPPTQTIRKISVPLCSLGVHLPMEQERQAGRIQGRYLLPGRRRQDQAVAFAVGFSGHRLRLPLSRVVFGSSWYSSLRHSST
jgi:hypothetical protein